MKQEKDKIGVSACLCGENCTYRGDSNLVPILKELDEEGHCVKICPEVYGGLTIPRAPAEIISFHPLRVMNNEGIDVTDAYVSGAELALEKLKKNNIKSVVLKSRSPSCGFEKIYDGTFSHRLIDGDGVFAKRAKEAGMRLYNEETFEEGFKMNHILKMKPVLHEKIWGGTALKEVYGYDIPSDHTGEAWVIAAHPNGDCTIDGGEFDGQKLSEVYAEHRELFGDIKDETFPLMVKIIDANDDLSVQVHPDDKYAAEHEHSRGKTESWYVLDAKEGTKMVMGHHAKTKEEFVKEIENDDYDHLLNVIEINKGDFFYIPSGTLHAICAGSLIYEAQQSSDITYRVYDYHRKDKNGQERELHVKQSIDVTRVPADLDQNTVFVNEKLDKGVKTTYLHCPYLSVYGYKIYGECEIKNDAPFQMVTCIDGEGRLNGMNVKKGDNFVICSDVETITYDGGMDLMVTTL